VKAQPAPRPLRPAGTVVCRTVRRREAALERTGMYSQRVRRATVPGGRAHRHCPNRLPAC